MADTTVDLVVYDGFISQMSKETSKPINEIMVQTAKYFIGKPYVANTLETKYEEFLVINFEEFDCTTFVETCIALSRVIKSDDYSLNNYIYELTSIRYRGANVDGYSSRLHYVSDWKYENEKNKVLTDITQQIGGVLVNKPIDFMSTHSQAYKILKNNNSEILKIAAIENAINARNNYYVIPVSLLAQNETKIKDGDIIVFATSVAGLDYSHIGIACRNSKGELSFIHASSAARKVLIQQNTLLAYCKSVKSNRGISVFRLNNVN